MVVLALLEYNNKKMDFIKFCIICKNFFYYDNDDHNNNNNNCPYCHSSFYKRIYVNNITPNNFIHPEYFLVPFEENINFNQKKHLFVLRGSNNIFKKFHIYVFL